MPILKPEIQEALRQSGLLSPEKEGIEESLDRAGLSLSETLETLGDIQNNPTVSEGYRLRAAETSLKVRGLMKDQQQPLPAITIVINDPHSPIGINPILIPREISLG